MKNWVDLSAHKARICVVRAPGRDDAIAIVGEAVFEEFAQEALRRAGFVEIKTGFAGAYRRSGGNFKLHEISAAFPSYVIREMSEEEIFLSPDRLDPPKPSAKMSPGADLFSSNGFGSFDGGDQTEAARGYEQWTLPVDGRAADDAIDTSLRVNEFQARYVPASKSGEATALVPLNYAQPLQRALNRLVAEVGDVDEYVATRLGWSLEELGNYLSPEQVDSVALGINGIEKGRGLIIADQTGQGKGRQLAALAVYARRRGLPVIFLTEKTNLFSDFWRDIADIGEARNMGAPYLMSDKAEISDLTQFPSPVLFRAPRLAEMKKQAESKEWPDDVSLLMAPYSRFSSSKGPWVDYLAEIADGAMFILDEVHNIVLESNQGKALAAAIERAGATVMSSATFARDPSNLLRYRHLMPASIRDGDIVESLTAGGTPLIEAVAQAMAEEGVLVRREHDLSEISLDVEYDGENAEQHRALSDQLSAVLAPLAQLSLEIQDEVDARNEQLGNKPAERQGKRPKPAQGNMVWSTGNFGSSLALLYRQFLLTITTDFAVRRSVECLQNDIKPAIVVENTMESLMREILDGDIPNGDRSQKDLFDGSEEAEQEDRPPMFRDALHLMLTRILTITLRVKGEKEPTRIVLNDWPGVQELRDAIDEFPDLFMSPIDEYRASLEREGQRLYEAGEIPRPWVSGEISARNMRVVDGKYVGNDCKDRNAVVAGFNAGAIDALMLTRAASTGLSLHASEKVKDQRKRRLMELQIPRSVVERVQFLGRVNRRGQVVEPEFGVLATTLPASIRDIAIQNRKMELLSATVSGSARSAFEADVPDMIDSLGNDVARRLLQERPMMARQMGISLKIDEAEAAEELYFINKILSRIVLLPSSVQDSLFAALKGAYEDGLRALAAEGKHPRHARELEGDWEVVDQRLFDAGVLQDQTALGRPVYLDVIKRSREARPLDSAGVMSLVDQGVAALEEATGEAQRFFEAHAQAVRAAKMKLLEAALPKSQGKVSEMLKARGDNPVKQASARLDKLVSTLRKLEPGWRLLVRNEDGEQLAGMIVGVKAPEIEKAHFPGRYLVRYVLPGDERPREISLAAILRDESIKLMEPAGSPGVAYDQAPRGIIEEERLVLTGNLFRSVQVATDARMGSLATYRVGGERRQGVLLPRKATGSIHSFPIRIVDPAVTMIALETGFPVLISIAPDYPGLRMIEEGARVVLTLPKDKTAIRPFMKKDLVELVGGYEEAQFGWSAVVSHETAVQLATELKAREKMEIIADGRARRDVAEYILANEPAPGEERDLMRAAL